MTQYPNGVSPDGCYDMAGNVWEWTDSWYDKDKDTKTLRGGSWLDYRNYARCSNRNPIERSSVIGFRCART